jgi:hypothetical protein
MKKSKIFFRHLIMFIFGSVGIIFYFYQKISALSESGEVASIALVPVAVVYIIAFGIICFLSFLLWLFFTK